MDIMNFNKEYYTAKELADKFGLSIQTVYSRFKSPYAEKRWGVSILERPDGSFQKVVYRKDLGKWKIDGNIYVGRPTAI